jgi:hypothetical protein
MTFVSSNAVIGVTFLTRALTAIVATEKNGLAKKATACSRPLPQKCEGTQLSTHKINSFRSLLGASLAILDQDPGSAKNSRPN